MHIRCPPKYTRKFLQVLCLVLLSNVTLSPTIGGELHNAKEEKNRNKILISNEIHEDYDNFTSTSTPAGKSSCINASMV